MTDHDSVFALRRDFPPSPRSAAVARRMPGARALWAIVGAAAVLAGCVSGPPPRIETGQPTPPVTGAAGKGRLQPASWSEIGGWTR
ncbi:hypothetical protein NK326_23455, partial [Salmonella enterica]|nr:hypothetical protein [Salmonella enterica]